MTTTKPTSEVEDEVKSERSGRRQDRDFQCNDHEMCDEKDDVISDKDDDDAAFEKEDDELCSILDSSTRRPEDAQQQQSDAR